MFENMRILILTELLIYTCVIMPVCFTNVTGCTSRASEMVLKLKSVVVLLKRKKEEKAQPSGQILDPSFGLIIYPFLSEPYHSFQPQEKRTLGTRLCDDRFGRNHGNFSRRVRRLQ